MLRALILTALTTFTPVEPTFEFTSDSVYKCDDILEVEFEKTEDFENTYLVNLEFKEVNRMGYKIYDNPETSYIDGLQWDHNWIENWRIENVDFSVAHTLTIKTVYTDDYAGMIMSAKDGDWTLLLQNPETILKLGYYALATLSIIISIFALLFDKNKKVKSADEISNKVELAAANFTLKANEMIDIAIINHIKPLLANTQEQYTDIIKGLMLSKSGKAEDTLALLELMKKASSKEEMTAIAHKVEENVKAEAQEHAARIEKAKADLHEVATSAIDKLSV